MTAPDIHVHHLQKVRTSVLMHLQQQYDLPNQVVGIMGTYYSMGTEKRVRRRCYRRT